MESCGGLVELFLVGSKGCGLGPGSRRVTQENIFAQAPRLPAKRVDKTVAHKRTYLSLCLPPTADLSSEALNFQKKNCEKKTTEVKRPIFEQ
jgi:hypothetical protein